MAEKIARKPVPNQGPPQHTGRSDSPDPDADDELPTYEDSTPGPSTLHASDSSTLHPQTTASTVNTPIGPTISSPFNFPSTTSEPAPPEYTNKFSRPIAIPQQDPRAAAPFLPAYPPVLLSHGIPSTSWYNFLDTTSAFLTATVGQRAISHAGEVAVSIGNVPKKLGKEMADHAKQTFNDLTQNAKRNPLSVVPGVIGATLGLTIGVALRTSRSLLTLPGTAVISSASPKTPKERALAYIAAANKDWFHKRGLHAALLETTELAAVLSISNQEILNATATHSASAMDQMNALKDVIEGVELRTSRESISGTGKAPAQPALSPAGFPADVKIALETPSMGDEASSSTASGSKASTNTQPMTLRLATNTLWLVLQRDEQPSIPPSI